MQRPTSIRTMLLILYFKMVVTLVFVVPAIVSNNVPDDFTTAQLQAFSAFVAVEFLSAVAMVVFIRKRKFLLALLPALLMLLLRSSDIQMMAALVIILLFFLKSTRDYFNNKYIPVAKTDADEESGEAALAEGETEASGEAADESDETSEESDKPDVVEKPKARPKTDLEVTLREATVEDADTIHSLMLIAFEEYRRAVPPSSALDETGESVRDALASGEEQAVLLYEDDVAVAMARFKIEGETIYFFRLSVIPTKRRRGYAKRLVKWIEHYGTSKGLNASRCKVRQTVQNNLRMYQDMGYEIIDQELVVRDTGSVKALLLEKSLRPQ